MIDRRTLHWWSLVTERRLIRVMTVMEWQLLAQSRPSAELCRSLHNHSVVIVKLEFTLLLNSDLADPAPNGMFPTALMGGHDG